MPGCKPCVCPDFESEAESLKLSGKGLVRQLTNVLI